MKHLFRKLFTVSLALFYTLTPSGILLAEESIASLYPEQELVKDEETSPGGAIQISTTFNFIGSSHFDKKRHRKFLSRQKNYYNEESIDGLAVFYYNPMRNEGLAALFGYTHTQFKWKENPFFHQSNFNNVNLGIVGFSHRLCDWLWKGQVNFNFDIDHFRWSQYITTDFFWWGRYEYSEHVGINLGLLAYTGMKIDHVYPILGFDWEITDRWKLNAIFPVDMSLIYRYNQDFHIVFAARAFYTRQRVGKDENVPRGLLQYENIGLEGGVTYDPQNLNIGWLKNFNINIHGGYAVGGRVKIANRHYRHKHRFYFKGAPYGGGEISLKF